MLTFSNFFFSYLFLHRVHAQTKLSSEKAAQLCNHRIHKKVFDQIVWMHSKLELILIFFISIYLPLNSVTEMQFHWIFTKIPMQMWLMRWYSSRQRLEMWRFAKTQIQKNVFVGTAIFHFEWKLYKVKANAFINPCIVLPSNKQLRYILHSYEIYGSCLSYRRHLQIRRPTNKSFGIGGDFS